MYPNDPGLKKKSSLKFLLVATVPGMLLGLFGSLVESSMKEPFKLMFDVWGLYTNFIPDLYGKAWSALWFGITNLKLYYVFFGVLGLLLGSGVALCLSGIVIGTFLGGVIYWLISIAQP
jgi:hypothetical protein